MRRQIKVKDGTAAKIAEMLEEAKAIAIERVDHDFEYTSFMSESPIERLFAAALVHPLTIQEYDLSIDILHPPSGLFEHCCPAPKSGVVTLFQQIQVGKFRVDFLLMAIVGDRSYSPLVVECDGHEFHERTKEQAQRDKARDRYLVGRGFRVLRFTGSEIYGDPCGCANEAISILLELGS